MEEILWLLAVPKESGLDSAMIPAVGAFLAIGRAEVTSSLLAMRRVLQLKHVTQCAMLEDFGIFLVLADKVTPFVECISSRDSLYTHKYLFAYHIEALVPTGPPGPNAQREPQRLNRNRDVQFFSVGTLNDRTLIIYMKKKGVCLDIFFC